MSFSRLCISRIFSTIAERVSPFSRYYEDESAAIRKTYCLLEYLRRTENTSPSLRDFNNLSSYPKWTADWKDKNLAINIVPERRDGKCGEVNSKRYTLVGTRGTAWPLLRDRLHA